MEKKLYCLFLFLFILSCPFYFVFGNTPGASYYTQKPNDPEAVYFTPQNF